MPPSILYLGHLLCTRLDLLRSNIAAHVGAKQVDQKAYHNQHCRLRKLHIGQTALACIMREGPKWVPGVLRDSIRPLTYLVQVLAGLQWKRHIDHLHNGGSVDQDLNTRILPDEELQDQPHPVQSYENHFFQSWEYVHHSNLCPKQH